MSRNVCDAAACEDPAPFRLPDDSPTFWCWRHLPRPRTHTAELAHMIANRIFHYGRIEIRPDDAGTTLVANGTGADYEYTIRIEKTR